MENKPNSSIDCIKQKNIPYLTILYTGRISDRHIIRFWKDLLSGNQWIPGTNVLEELSCADLSGLSCEGIKLLVYQMKQVIQKKGEHLKAKKMAMFAPEPLQYGMARVFEVLGMDVAGEIKVFENLDHAVAWLKTSRGELYEAAGVWK